MRNQASVITRRRIKRDVRRDYVQLILGCDTCRRVFLPLFLLSRLSIGFCGCAANLYIYSTRFSVLYPLFLDY